MRRRRQPIASFVIAFATAIGILAITILLFLNPVWVGFEQGRAEAAAWTGFTEAELRVTTDAILADLVVGPPDFDVAVDGAPVLNDRERSHMRDVRTVFAGYFAVSLVVVAAGVLVAVRSRRAGAAGRAASWRAVRNGAAGLIIGLVAVGGVALVAFDVLFEAFHRIFFAGGSYTFDPDTERLVQLFPFQFWQETAIVLGIVAIVVATFVTAFAQWRLSGVEAAAAAELVAEPAA